MPSRNAAAAGRAANAPCAQTRLAPHLRRRPRARAAPSYACSSAFPFPLSIHRTSLACQCKLTFYPVQRVSPGRSGSSLAADAAAVWRRSLDVATFEHPTTCQVVACRAKIFFLRTRIKSLPGAYAISPYEAKYPPATASFHVRRTEGTMPTGQILLRCPKAVHAGPKRVRAILGAGFIFRRPGLITIFINLPTVVAAPLWKSRKILLCSLRRPWGRDDLGEFAVRGCERDEGADEHV